MRARAGAGLVVLALLGGTGIAGGPALGAEPAGSSRPTKTPERIILTWCGDPSSSQAVTWRTSTEVEKGLAEIAPAQTGPRFYRKNGGKELKRIRFSNGLRRVEAQTSLFELNELKCHVHSVRFEELAPGTRYVYRVGDGKNWSEWFQFRTASREMEPFSFIYFGDTQNELASMCSWVVREAYASAPRAAFTLHAGDLTNGRGLDPEWGEWFQMMGWINAMIPAVVTPGNHDYDKPRSEEQPGSLEPHWRAQFTLPEHGPPGVEETAYYIDYQGARIVSLDSMSRREEQARWLDRVLTDNPNAWTILTFHYPVFAICSSRTSLTRKDFKPVIDRHNVDLVLTGHDHAYSRTGLIGPEGEVPSGTAARGTVYAVSVSGPKMNRIGAAKGEPDPEKISKRLGEDTQLYQIITIDGRKLRYESWTASGLLYDAFTLIKSADGSKELVNQALSVPQRRRVGPDLDYDKDR